MPRRRSVRDRSRIARCAPATADVERSGLQRVPITSFRAPEMPTQPARRRESNDREALAARGLTEPGVGADEIERRWILATGNQGGGQLHCICASQGMDAQQTESAVTDTLPRRDLPPIRSEESQPFQTLTQFQSVNCPLSMQSIQSRSALDLTSPPSDDERILFKQVDPTCRVRLIDQQRHQRRRIPILHRSSFRSSATKRLALCPAGRRGLGAARNEGRSRRILGGFMIPSSIKSIAASSISESASNGLIWATALPRCVTRTVSPRRTSARRALRPFFAWLTLARFI